MRLAIEIELKPDLAWKFEAIVRKCCSKPSDEESRRHFAALLLELGIEKMHDKLFGEDRR
jgi:hypothetical protein